MIWLLTDWPAFAAGLWCMVALAGWTGWRHTMARAQLWRVGAVLAANWLAGMVFTYVAQDATPWIFNILIDAGCAGLILIHPAGRAQIYIGLFYAVQLVWHVAFGIRTIAGLAVSSNGYYEAITLIAWAQLLAVGAWCGGLWLQDSLSRFRHRRGAVDSHACAGVMGESP